MEEIKILVVALVSFLSQENIPIGARSAEIVINRQTKQIQLYQYDLYSFEAYRDKAVEGLDSLMRATDVVDALFPMYMTSKHFYEEDGKLNAVLYLQYQETNDLRKISFYSDDQGNLSYPYMKAYTYGLQTGSVDNRYVRFSSGSEVKFTMRPKENKGKGIYSLLEDWKALEATQYVDVSKLFSKEDYTKLRNFIFKNGDRQTFRNFDNDNPHYRFDTIDVYLGTGDQKRGLQTSKLKTKAYSEMVIHADRYYTLYLATEKKANKHQDQLIEGRVYWYNRTYQDSKKMEAYLTRLSAYVEE